MTDTRPLHPVPEPEWDDIDNVQDGEAPVPPADSWGDDDLPIDPELDADPVDEAAALTGTDLEVSRSSEMATIIAQAISDDLALHLPPDLTWSQWVGLGKHLHKFARGAHWWLGDWLVTGDHQYGEKYAQAMEITGIGADSLIQMQTVSSKFAPEDRRPDISWTAHRIAGRLETPAERNAVLAWAVEHGKSTRELEQEVKRRQAIDVDSSETDGKVEPKDPATTMCLTFAFYFRIEDQRAALAKREEAESELRSLFTDAGAEPYRITVSDKS